MENDIYNEKLIRKLQLTELEILTEFVRVCDANNINYIIDAGTLLGAVRHGGFIPWDDDIDIRMLRTEYDKFCEVCKNQLNKKYFLQTYKTDKEYRWAYARILKNNTVFIRKNHQEIKSRNGIFIDIFPCDNLPQKPVGRWNCTVLSLICRKMLYSQVGRKHAATIFRRIGFAVLDMFPKQWAYNVLEFLTKKYENCETAKVRCFGWGDKVETIGFQKEWLEKTRKIYFENILVKAPENTHDFLVASFGDSYMEFPPENERRPKHIAEYIEF